uniref:Heat shock protein 70 n=1 Tax=Panagrolaimus superbus TaxID=310955 RepID=A0A914Z1G2_9BILA
MICGLFTRYKIEDQEFLAQIDGINTEKNNFRDLENKIEENMPIYSPTNLNVKIIYVAVYPDGYIFEDTSNLVFKHFSHKDTDRAKGALIFAKNKVNGIFGDYIEIEEKQKSEVKVMKELSIPTSTSWRSSSKSSNIQNVVEKVYQQNYQKEHEKNVVGIDIGTTTCRAVAIIDNENINEKCGIGKL